MCYNLSILYSSINFYFILFLDILYIKHTIITPIYPFYIPKKQKRLTKVSLFLVRPRGFEPPTVRFVAEYSIQLSYEHITIKYYIEIFKKINT